MNTKKKKVKYSKNLLNIDNDIEQLSQQVNEIKTTTNLNKIVSDRALLQDKIKNINNSIDKLKELMNITVDEVELNDDFDFDESYIELENMVNQFWNDELTIVEQIKTYNKIKSIIALCTTYFESKKMDLHMIDKE